MHRDELKPCPFCGGPGYTTGDVRSGFFAFCSDCYACVGEAYDRDAVPEHLFREERAAAEAWNSRAAISAALEAEQPVVGDESIDARMKAAGMYTIAEMMGVTPLTKWMSNPAINSIEAFSEWLGRKVSEYLHMKAAYDLGDKDESDELYEWVLAHSAVFSTIRDQLQVVRSSLSQENAGVGSATSTTGAAKHYYCEAESAWDGGSNAE